MNIKVLLILNSVCLIITVCYLIYFAKLKLDYANRVFIYSMSTLPVLLAIFNGFNNLHHIDFEQSLFHMLAGFGVIVLIMSISISLYYFETISRNRHKDS